MERNTVEAFWSTETRSEHRIHPYDSSLEPCWIWPGKPEGPKGYGRFMLNRKRWKVHSLSLTLTSGPRPQGMLACHSCDVRLCWNPSHLRWGTPQGNVKDMLDRGRRGESKCLGETNGQARLTASQVVEIRDLYAVGDVTQRTLATQFGVHEMQISKIVNRKQWRHL